MVCVRGRESARERERERESERETPGPAPGGDGVHWHSHLHPHAHTCEHGVLRVEGLAAREHLHGPKRQARG
jgi:hypothetical protein